jgi:Flp pilus assembly protein TadD
MGRKRSRHGGIEDGMANVRALPTTPADGGDAVEVLVARARKCRLRGDARKALVLLREACALDEWRARTWTLLGVFLAELGQGGEAAQALKQARWLRVRAGERSKAAVMDQLIARLLPAAA